MFSHFGPWFHAAEDILFEAEFLIVQGFLIVHMVRELFFKGRGLARTDTGELQNFGDLAGGSHFGNLFGRTSAQRYSPGMPAKDLSITQLKKRLVEVADKTSRVMAPMLYFLREKIKAQGKAGEGFGAWVEDNLHITRRTADRWADLFAIASGLKKPKPKRKAKQLLDRKSKSSVPDGKVTVNVNFVLSEQEQDEFLEAMEILGEQAERIIYDAVINAAKKRPASVNQTHSHSAHA